MRFLVLSLALLASSGAWAQTKGSSNVLGDVGFSRGGLTVGAGYEYLYDGSQGLGGQVHLYQKDTDNKHLTDGYFIVGAFTGFHFFKGTWDLSFAPGVNIINITGYNSGRKDETVLGPSMSISLTTALNDKVAIGFDYANYWAWFSDNYRGHLLDDLDFKVKVSF